MKASIYNLFAPLPDGKDYALLNTLSLSKAIVDAETKQAIESDNLKDIDEPELTALKDIGAIVEDHVDEKVILKVVYEKDINDPEMLELGVLPTFKCNLSCPFCYRIKDEHPERNEGKSITDRIIKFAKNTIVENNCKWLLLGLTGGEPLLALDKCLRLVGELHTWCANKDVRFEAMIGTNATLITQEIIDAFSKYPVCFCTSLDGPKHINDKRRPYRDGKGSYDDIIKALRMVKNSNMLCRIATTVDKQNVKHIDEFLDELNRNELVGSTIVFGPTRGDIGTLTDRPPSWITNHCFEGTELPQVLPEIWRKAMEKGFTVDAFEGTFHENTARRLQYIVGVYGDVYKSCGGVGSGKKELSIGHIDANGRLVYDFVYYKYVAYDIFSDPKCRDCNVLPICQGKIDPVGHGDDGMMYRGDCSSFKELLKGSLIVHLQQDYPDKKPSLQISSSCSSSSSSPAKGETG